MIFPEPLDRRLRPALPDEVWMVAFAPFPKVKRVPAVVILPLLSTVNFVTPLTDADSKSPRPEEFVWLMTKALLPPFIVFMPRPMVLSYKIEFEIVWAPVKTGI